MTDPLTLRHDRYGRLRLALWLTWFGVLAERLTHSFWPLWSSLFIGAAALIMGLHDLVPLEVAWGFAVLVLVVVVGTFGWGIRTFRFPSRREAKERLDRMLPGRPIAALEDTMAIGAGDLAATAVWNEHLARMAAAVRNARAVGPNLRISDRDPFAVRYVAVLFLTMALLFGSVLKVTSVTEITPGGNGYLATGPSWEGWVEPPAYTGKPSLYLNDVGQSVIVVPESSRVTLRLYGEPGALTAMETVSGRSDRSGGATDPVQSFKVNRSGTLAIEGSGGSEWVFEIVDDEPPEIQTLGEPARGLMGEMRQTFLAKDDYGVVSGYAMIALDLASVDRRHGLTADPEPRPLIELDLPITISGDRAEFTETLVENFSEHPWAMLPVEIELFALDALAQEGAAAPNKAVLPGRRFFDPLAAAIIEQRRDLLWNRSNGSRVAQVLRAISHRPEGLFNSDATYLKLRYALRQLEQDLPDALTGERRDGIAEALWDIALMIEDGDLADVRERLRSAQERLREAMRNGATEEEIASLMQELREAMQDFIRQLAEQGQQGQEQAQNQQNAQEFTGSQLQDLLDRLQELMEQGRMDEAQALLDRLAEMMENLQVAQGQQPGQQAMDGLGETLRQQQELSDDTFGELQENFGQQGESGQMPGQPGGEGGNGQFSQGQGQPGNGQSGSGPGQGGGTSPEELAERQWALMRELQRQSDNLPGAGGPEGDAAREALSRAGEAMDDAGEALAENDLSGALDSQAEAIDALRDGMRNLGEALAQRQMGQPGQPGQQGDAFGNQTARRPLDPLGREPGARGWPGADEQLLQDEDAYRRAHELMDEIRRRSGDRTRPESELDYLRRLLERF